MALPDNLPLPRGAPLDEQDREGWRITDERSAEWVMRKLARFRDRMDEQRKLKAEYQAQLDEWWGDATRSLASDINWAEGLLIDWAMSLREADPESKSQVLPSGRVATRWIPPHPNARDASALAQSLARGRHPDYDRIVKAHVTVDARALAKVVTVADEWRVSLNCGCTAMVWQLGPDLSLEVNQVWPWRADEHRQRGCAEQPLSVVGFSRGRTRQAVATIDRGNGDGVRVIPLDGIDWTPGRVAAVVTPR